MKTVFKSLQVENYESKYYEEHWHDKLYLIILLCMKFLLEMTKTKNKKFQAIYFA